MADMAVSGMTVDLGEGKQVVVSAGQGVYLQLWAHGGSLGVLLTVGQADEIKKALMAAIVKITVEQIDVRTDCR